MPVSQRTILAAVLCVSAAAGLAACGDDGPRSPSTTGPAASGPSATAPEQTSPDAGPTEDSAAELVGLDEDEATEAAEDRGWTVRVVRRDGEDLPATLDLRPNRVNVEVTDGVVTAVIDIG